MEYCLLQRNAAEIVKLIIELGNTHIIHITVIPLCNSTLFINQFAKPRSCNCKVVGCDFLTLRVHCPQIITLLDASPSRMSVPILHITICLVLIASYIIVSSFKVSLLSSSSARRFVNWFSQFQIEMEDVTDFPSSDD